MQCCHCGQPARRPVRGLCQRCYRTPAVRHLYPLRCRRGPDPAGAGRALPEPTQALPQTPEKVDVLEERAQRGLALWHPLDARWSLK